MADCKLNGTEPCREGQNDGITSHSVDQQLSHDPRHRTRLYALGPKAMRRCLSSKSIARLFRV
jgi:hypothetical protein